MAFEEELVTTSAADAAGLALYAADMLRPGPSCWVELGERAVAVLSIVQRAKDAIAVANRLLATVDDVETVSRIQTHAVKALWAFGAESYGLLLLRAGERQLGLELLDTAWDDYDRMGAVARRVAVQRGMRQAGTRRTKWSNNRSDRARKPLTEAERRVVYLIADGHSDKSAARTLGISVNTVGTHKRSAFTKLGVRSRVQLTNALRQRSELE